MAPKNTDPRTHVTPDAFAVAESLLGQELAAPWRRGVALLLDLVLIFALTQTGGLAFSILLSATAFWLVVRRARGWRSVLIRGNAGLVVAVVVLVVSLALVWEDPSGGPSVAEWQAFGEAMGSQDPLVREAAVLELEESFEQQTAGLEEELSGVPGVDAAKIFGRLDAAQSPDEAEQARREMVRQYAKVTAENQRLREQVDHPSLRYLAQAVVTDLGLSIGWTGLYFSLFPALWRGRTPGKFVLGLRIVRLDLSPIRPWTAFERFAGYAAGLATGLLGFVQIFWDANRQGVQDKIVGTVVIRERQATEPPATG